MDREYSHATQWSLGKQAAAAALLAAFVSTRSLSSFFPLYGVFDSSVTQSDIYEYYAVLQVISIIFFAGILLANKSLKGFLEHNRWPMAAAGACGSVGSIAILVSQFLGSSLFGFLGLTLLALYPALYLPAVGVRLVSLDLRAGCTVVAVSFAIAELYRFIYLLAPSAWIACITLFPLLASVMLVFFPHRPASPESGKREQATASSSHPAEANSSLFLLIGSAVALCILSAVFSRLLSNPTLGSISFGEQALTLFATIVVFASFAVVIRFAPLSIDTLTLLYAFCSFVLLTTLVLVVFFTFQATAAQGVALLKTTQRIFEAMLMTSVLFAAKRSHLSPVIGFALYGALVISALNLLSNGLAAPANQYIELFNSPRIIPLTAVVTLASLIIVAVTLTAIALRRHKDHQVDAREYNARLCEFAGREKGLTPREVEVMQYLYQGYSVSKISEVMFIASSTVQGHSRNIYRKMDVHSRQELIDTINESFV